MLVMMMVVVQEVLLLLAGGHVAMRNPPTREKEGSRVHVGRIPPLVAALRFRPGKLISALT